MQILFCLKENHNMSVSKNVSQMHDTMKSTERHLADKQMTDSVNVSIFQHST